MYGWRVSKRKTDRDYVVTVRPPRTWPMPRSPSASRANQGDLDECGAPGNRAGRREEVSVAVTNFYRRGSVDAGEKKVRKLTSLLLLLLLRACSHRQALLVYVCVCVCV